MTIGPSIPISNGMETPMRMFPYLSQPTSKLSRMGGGKRACWQAIVITHILLISHMHHNAIDISKQIHCHRWALKEQHDRIFLESWENTNFVRK